MVRRMGAIEARRLGFDVMANGERPNPLPIEWAEEAERLLREQGWGNFEVVLIDGLCSYGDGEAIGSSLLGFYARDRSHDRFMGTAWHEAAHCLQHRYGMKEYPRPPLNNPGFMLGFNMAEVGAEDFRQLFGPPEAAAIPHKYDGLGYGLGYHLPQVIQDLGDWKALRERIRRWWLINCNDEFVQAQKNWMQLTWERIQALLRRLKGEQ